MTTRRPPVVVGVDGSAPGWQAIHVGAWEAARRGTALQLIHGYPDQYPYMWYGWTPPFATSVYDPQPPAAAMLDETAQRVRGYYPDLTVTTSLYPGNGARALVEASADAALVVVGARGQGGFGGLSIGSVAAQTAAHAAAPVLVVRPSTQDGSATEAAGEDAGGAPETDITAPAGPIPTPGPVLVGIDGSAHTGPAVEFAYEEAALRRVPLIAVQVWWTLPADNLGPDKPGYYNQDAAKEEARRLLAELMAGWTDKYPDVTLELRPVEGMNPSYELIQASAGAGLVVVGSRGRGGFSGLLLGSVGRDLVGHAQSPVAVVHAGTPTA